jgi:hypothetical protein
MHNIRAIVFMYWLIFASIGALIIRAIFEISKDVGLEKDAGESYLKRTGSSAESKLSDPNTDASKSVTGGMRGIIEGVCNFNEMFRNFTELLPVFPKINIDRFGSEDNGQRTTTYLRAKKDL